MNGYLDAEHIPQVLYKFRDWENPKHQRVLTHNELFFASPRCFNDPFDMRVVFRYDHLGEVEWRALFEDLNSLRTAGMTRIERSRYINGLMANVATEEQRRDAQEYLRSFYVDSLDDFGVCTFSARRDSIPMWSYYSRDHKGFCLGINPAFLQTDSDDKHTTTLLKRVKYYDNYPVIPPAVPRRSNVEQLIEPFLVKSDQWRHEQEYRSIMMDSREVRHLDSAQRQYVVPDEAIVEVILGCNIPDKYRKEILREVENKEPRPAVYEACAEKDEFKLKMVPVSFNN